MKKLFTQVFGVLFAMCANAVTLDIGEPNNNTPGGNFLLVTKLPAPTIVNSPISASLRIIEPIPIKL